MRIEYWSTTDPWIVAPGSAGAKARMKELLTANPQNLTAGAGFLRGPKSPTFTRLETISVPVLIVAGEADIPDVHAHIGAIHAQIPDSKRVVLARSGHLCHMEVPEEFNRVVAEFLKGPGS